MKKVFSLPISITVPFGKKTKLSKESKSIEIVGFSVDRMVVSFKAKGTILINDLRKCKSIAFSQKITLQRERAIKKLCFSGHGFRLSYSNDSFRPVLLEICGEACRKFSETELLQFVDDLQRYLDLESPNVSISDLALDVLNFPWSPGEVKKYAVDGCQCRFQFLTQKLQDMRSQKRRKRNEEIKKA